MSESSDRPFIDEILAVDPDHYTGKNTEPGYEFSGPRKFDSTDNLNGGAYGYIQFVETVAGVDIETVDGEKIEAIGVGT
jgi:hypothetical protein